jgi:two-component system response regulator FlrC
MRNHTVLVVEDDRHLQEALVSTLETAGFAVLSASDGGEALRILDESTVDLVVTDVQMKPVDGRELLRQLKHKRPMLPVLMMTAFGTIEQAVAAMRDGAADYLVKPFEADDLERCVTRHMPGRVHNVRGAPVARDPKTASLFELAEKVAASELTVLLSGESGTGKEVFARFIHEHSPRHDQPFVAVNCAAIPDQMLEALLFGHEKGAFTGAQTRSQGKFLQANGGTLLLDEITEMEFSLQAKLLRVLQEREVEPLGAAAPIPLDVRVLATSNRDLEQAVKQGHFREDLYYRLSVFPIEIPPLRQRPADVAALAESFVAEQFPSDAPAISPAALEQLQNHSWPGNVRELQNAIQRALVMSAGERVIEPHHFVLDGMAATAATPGLAGELWEEEARRIAAALEQCSGSRKQAAVQLGISARTLRYKLARMRTDGFDLPGERMN